MSRRRRTLAAPVGGRLAVPLLAAALVLSSCTASQDPGPSAGPTSAPGTGTAAPTADAPTADAPTADAPTADAPTADGTPGSTPDGAGGATPGTDVGTQTGGAGAEPETAGSAAPDGRSGGQSGGEGSEVAPPAPGRSSGDSLGDSTGPAAGRLTREQQTGTAAGLLAGFPDDVVRVPAGTAVESSSVTGTGGRYQVTLDATVDGGCDAVVLDYRAWFTTGGFTETDTTARPGRTTVDLARDDGTVQLGASRTGSGCNVTLFAALSAE